MSPELPVVDDTLIWDAWMALYKVPAMSVALELDIFEQLLDRPQSIARLADTNNFSDRGLKALLPMLAHMGLLCLRNGEYHLSEAGRHYMIKNSPFYWGNVFKRISGTVLPHKLLLESVRGEQEKSDHVRPADGWESGEMEPAMARDVTAFMHSHSAASAAGLARNVSFSGQRKLLDVGGGSGCFSIALARANPQLHCTIMELPVICTLANDYIREAGMQSRVKTQAVDMFRQPWPQGHDGVFFSNVFHDWSFDTCAELAQKAFDVLPPGGRIVLHEMLLDDDESGPQAAIAFSLLMAMGTRGQQFSFPQLLRLLTSAGFVDVNTRQTYGYYSVVTGTKP